MPQHSKTNNPIVTPHKNKLTEEQLNRHLTTIIENSGEAILSKNLDGIILTWNKAAELMYGYNEKEMVGNYVHILCQPGKEKEIDKILSKVKRNQVIKNFETVRITKSKEKIFVSLTVIPVKNNTKEIIGASVIAHNLTPQKKIEKSIKESKKKYLNLIKNAPIGIIESKRDGEILNSNLAFVKMIGYSTIEEVLKLNVEDDIYFDKRIRKHILDQISSGGLLSGIDIQLKKKKGEIIWAHLNSHIVRDPFGEPLYFQNFLIDITKQRKIQQHLFEQERSYRSLVESSIDPIYVIQNKRLALVNRSWTKLFGYTEEEVYSRNFKITEIIAPDSRELIDERMRFYDKNGKALSALYEMSGLTKSGKIVQLEVSVSSIIWLGKPALQGVYRNITERKQHEQLLLQAKENAERSDRLKTEFLAQMSHEIRTPLNNILTYASLLKEELEDKIPKDFESVFTVIDSSSHRLIRTIDLILNLSKIQTGNFETKFEKIDLDNDILEDISLEFFQQAARKNVKLSYNRRIKDSLISGDMYSVSQIFINLIENAIKFTENGKISIILDNYRDKIRVSITDTGIGITKENQQKIFEPFTRENQGYYPGTGLGLSLVKKYAEVNNASIKLKSIKGKGTTFMIFFDHLKK